MMEVIGIIGAMGSEVQLLKSYLENCKETTVAGRTFFEGSIHQKKVVLVCSGIGKVNSAITAQILIDHFQVSAIINTGIAGGAGNVHIRDIVVSTETVYHDMDAEILSHSYPFVKFFESDTVLTNLAIKVCKDNHITVHAGRIATGDQFVSEASLKEEIIKHVSPMAIEMEGCSIAHTCNANGIPFVVVRSISDNADDGAEMSYDTFEQLAANDAAKIVIAMLDAME